MTQAYDPNPALFWWEHLTKDQRAFLLAEIDGFMISLNEVDSEAAADYWYDRSQLEDLHRLSGWPETPDSVFRTI